MCPDVFQFLTYMAAKTEHVQLGSMVCVLPWHDPVRVAEQISMLDNLSNGRVILGMGRGTGRVEFDGFVSIWELLDFDLRSAEIVLTALEQGWIEYSGDCFTRSDEIFDRGQSLVLRGALRCGHFARLSTHHG